MEYRDQQKGGNTGQSVPRCGNATSLGYTSETSPPLRVYTPKQTDKTKGPWQTAIYRGLTTREDLPESGKSSFSVTVKVLHLGFTIDSAILS